MLHVGPLIMKGRPNMSPTSQLPKTKENLKKKLKKNYTSRKIVPKRKEKTKPLESYFLCFRSRGISIA